MASLYFVSFINRAPISLYRYHSRFLFKKLIGSSLNKGLISRSYISSSKTALLKLNIKSVSLYLPKSKYKKCIEVQTFRVNHFVTTFEHRRYIHTSERRYFYSRLRPVWKFLAVISASAFKKWRDPLSNKGKYFFMRMIENRENISWSFAVCGFRRFAFAITFVMLSVIYYISHIEETPITGRRRFIAIHSKQQEKIYEFQLKQIMTDMDVLPSNHPHYSRVNVVVDRILTANQNIKEIKEKTFNVLVVNSSSENALALPTGYVFVSTGMLSLCSNDELGAILSHEIAHIVLNHITENINFCHLLDLILIIIFEAIWAIMPSDILSPLTDWLYEKYKNKIINIFSNISYSRKIETEADTVGLQLAARACFDVRESSAFWDKMAILHRFDKVPILDSHPSHKKRSEYLNSIMDQAIALRKECGCPKLKPCDPRSTVEVLTRALEAAKYQQIESQ